MIILLYSEYTLHAPEVYSNEVDTSLHYFSIFFRICTLKFVFFIRTFTSLHLKVKKYSFTLLL